MADEAQGSDIRGLGGATYRRVLGFADMHSCVPAKAPADASALLDGPAGALPTSKVVPERDILC